VNKRVTGLLIVGVALMAMFGFLAIPMLIAGETSLLFSSNGGTGCTASGGAPSATQPGASAAGKSIPADYLVWYKKVGQQYGIPWTVLAGIGTEESDNGQSTLPGVHSGTNSFGAAGPMQIGVGGASTNTWASVATNEDGKGAPSVYDPADAIAGAAKYLNQHGYQSNPQGAIFAYNHADWYVQDVLNFASQYSSGGFTVTADATQPGGSGTCAGNMVLDSETVPNTAVATAIDFAQQQLGKPYLWGGTGPEAFDCSGLMMMAYRQAGIYIARTSQAQWATEQHVPASQVRPGDLVFFAGSDGTPTAPGHVGMVIGGGKMIEAYATGYPIRISTYGKPTSAAGDQTVVGFTNPWAGASKAQLSGSGASALAGSGG
jgi:peptidoglycan DL-endopeptidase CwlO